MDRLDNTIRPYAWGSTTAIPRLLGTEPTGEPQAEMWMGAHPGAPSRTDRGTLVEVIDADPERELGPDSVAKFGPRRGTPMQIDQSRAFTSYHDAVWACFRARWKEMTGRDCPVE